ncbi:MAG: hypothetical protein ABI690_26580 [Chloroflexota bacterium]
MRIRIGWILLLLLAVPLIARADSKPLPETYVSDDGVTTFQYPTGWTIDVQHPGLVTVSSKDHPFLFGSDFMSQGEAAVMVIFSDAADAYFREYFEADNPAAMMNHIIQKVFAANLRGDLKFTALETIQFGDFPAVHTSTTFRDNNFSAILADRGNGLYTLAIGITTISASEKYAPKLLAIAESVTYQPPSS